MRSLATAESPGYTKGEDGHPFPLGFDNSLMLLLDNLTSSTQWVDLRDVCGVGGGK